LTFPRIVLTTSREIIDESDVYVDVHKAIRRTHPAPKMHVRRSQRVKDVNLIDIDENTEADGEPLQRALSVGGGKVDPTSMLSSSPKTTLLMRRSSAGQDGQLIHTMVPVKANYEEMRDHLKHLGPSNPASNPKSTRVTAVKIKPGTAHAQSRSASVAADIVVEVPNNGDGADERTSLLRPQLTGKDGVQALRQSYTNPTVSPKGSDINGSAATAGAYTTEEQALEQNDQANQTHKTEPAPGDSPDGTTSSGGSFPLGGERKRQSRGYVRSGSITENVVEAGGIRKVVLEATSSGDDGELEGLPTPGQSRPQSVGLTVEPVLERDGEDEDGEGEAAGASADGASTDGTAKPGSGKKNRRRNRKGAK
jgi:metal transporter CNNM